MHLTIKFLLFLTIKTIKIVVKYYDCKHVIVAHVSILPVPDSDNASL